MAEQRHRNHCLDCRTKNCYHRALPPKLEACLELDYREEIRLSPPEIELTARASGATKKVFEAKAKGDFTLNWLKGFIRSFFGDGVRVGIACCLGAIESARSVSEALEGEGLRTALVTCKLGGLTIEHLRAGEPYGHPGCNPIAQAHIFNTLEVPVVVLVGLCIGHDMLFIRHCRSYVIPFITKMPLTFGAI